MTRVKISPKYQVVIPREIREKLSIKPGEEVMVFQYGDRIEFIRVGKMTEMRGFLKGIDTDVERDEDKDGFKT